MRFIRDVWEGYRPYLVKLAQDFLIGATLWAMLFAFHQVTHRLPVESWAGRFVVSLHSVGLVVMFGLVTWLSFNDVIIIHRLEREKFRGAEPRNTKEVS